MAHGFVIIFRLFGGDLHGSMNLDSLKSALDDTATFTCQKGPVGSNMQSVIAFNTTNIGENEPHIAITNTFTVEKIRELLDRGHGVNKSNV